LSRTEGASTRPSAASANRSSPSARPAELIEVRQAFAEPIGAAETIARYIAKLSVQLCDALELKGLGARRLDLICHRVDNRAQAVRVGTALPLRDAKRMTRLLSDKIETIEPGFGIEMMTLAAAVAEPLAAKQAVTDLVEEAEPDVSGLIDLLANRVGEQKLYRIAPVASDVPERSAQGARAGATAAANGPATPLQSPAPWPGYAEPNAIGLLHPPAHAAPGERHWRMVWKQRHGVQRCDPVSGSSPSPARNTQ
jgi:protein ImuB